MFYLKFAQWMALCVVVVLGSVPAMAESYVWRQPPMAGSVYEQFAWSNTNHWDPSGVPSSLDSATLLGGSCQVFNRVDVKALTISGAELFGPGPVVTEQLTVTGGHLADAAALNYTNFPTGEHALEFHETAQFGGTISVRMKLRNFGEALTTNATLRAHSTMYDPPEGRGAHWWNTPGSELVLGGQTLFIYSSYPMQQYIPFVNDLGAVVRKTGTNFSRVEWRLSGLGSVVVENGLLQFNYPEEINGAMTVQAGGRLRFDHSAEDLIIGPEAKFNGDGRLEFYGSHENVFVMADKVFNVAAGFTNGIFHGESMVFTRPVDWRGTAWNNPVHFMMGGSGAGTISNSMVNFGLMLDAGISSVPGTWALNLPPSLYYASNSFQGSFSLQGTNQNRFGWLTNSLGATLHVKQAPGRPSIRWNVRNDGIMRFDAGTRPQFPGSLTQGPTGVMELNGQLMGVQAHLNLDGHVSGWGSITSHNVRVTGTLSPSTTNSPFGNLEMRAANNFFTAFPTNRITLEPTTVLEVDLGAPGTTNDFFTIFGPTDGHAGTVNVRAQEGFGPGSFPFITSTSANLKFGTVPPGYRYSFGTNGNRLTIEVTQPGVPTALVQRSLNGTNNVELVLNTISNATYQVDYTDNLGAQPWQPWTNFIGQGGSLVLPVETNSPSRIFRVTEE